MNFDLDQLARRLASAADLSRDLDVTVSTFDLIFSRDGHGAGRSESVPFAALFLSDEDLLGQALARLGRSPEPAADHQAGTPGAETSDAVVSAADAPSMSAWPRDVAIAREETR